MKIKELIKRSSPMLSIFIALLAVFSVLIIISVVTTKIVTLPNGNITVISHLPWFIKEGWTLLVMSLTGMIVLMGVCSWGLKDDRDQQ